MPDGSSVVRELVTILGFDIDEAALSEFDRRVQSIRKNLRRMAIAAGIAAGAIAAVTVKVARAGDDLAKTSRRLGLSVEGLQEWRFAAERSGIATATFDMAMQRFGRRAAEAARGTGEAVKALARLGVQTKDANGSIRSMDELLEDALTALAGIESPLERNALAMKLFDSEGVKVVQMLEGGSAALVATRKRFRELGAVMDEQTTVVAEDTVNAWTDFRAALFGVVLEMGKKLMPIVRGFLQLVTEWLGRNRTLVAAIGFLTIALISLASAIFGIVAAKAAWVAVTALLGKEIMIVIGVISAGLIKLIAIVAGLFLIAEDFTLWLTGSADTVTGRVVNAVSRWLGVAWRSWSRWITTDLPNFLLGVWQGIIERFITAWNALVESLKRRLGDMISSVLPQPVLDAIKALGPHEGPSQRAQALAFGAQAFAAANIPSPAQARANMANVNITVNQAPGQTPGVVAREIATVLMSDPVVDAALTGLGK